MASARGEVLLSEKKFYTFAHPPDLFTLESGVRFGPITVAYETWGELNREKDNAILVLHALTGDSHATGKYHPDDRKEGWWAGAIGPGLALDTDKYFIICSNVLGGCQGTTGPSSINPATGKPYGMSFPVITIRDMVRVQRELLRHLGIEHLRMVIGGSMGGMQALEWIVNFPDMMDKAVVIAVSARMSAQGIAYNLVGRRAIMNDPNWNNGDYYDKEPPRNGLALARMIGMITYQCAESMEMKFGREINCEKEEDLFRMDSRFEVENYLYYQGDALVRRFDANSYLYLCKAMDLYDVARGYESLVDAFSRVQAETLVIGISSDILFPTYQQKEIVQALRAAGKKVYYEEIKSPYGHDAFLIEYDKLNPIIKRFLEK
ncbi:MAG: homoserine O-acetyltransferase/O-succinyltransferase [Eubacteriales bacterium]|nr:homoserine O-acetyltransferase/O-succinyltransferase [Eubacteriales bacterium]MDN5363757.1 homoserine O-acetyltransferase/O-succinyltransferase [Eubacteriales bacterium]